MIKGGLGRNDTRDIRLLGIIPLPLAMIGAL